MNITLPVDLEQRVRERIERGDYDNVNALVHEAVQRLVEEDEQDQTLLLVKLQEANAEIDRGMCMEFDAQTTRSLARDIQERGRARVSERQEPGTS